MFDVLYYRRHALYNEVKITVLIITSTNRKTRNFLISIQKNVDFRLIVEIQSKIVVRLQLSEELGEKSFSP